VSAFYSLQDAKSPMKAAIVALLVNAVFSVILMFPLKHGGLALATSIATSVNVIMLSVILKKRIGVFLNREFYRSIYKMLLSSLAMWVVIIIIGIIIPWRDKGPLDERLLYLILCIFAGTAAYFIAASLTKCSEMTMIIDMLKRKMRRPKVQ
jgi:putative peptidoglycan lipid II flippase